MARVTVEDCLEQIPNRFDLVMLAARRARDITLGAPPHLEEENDKPTVIALREIAEGKVTLEYLEEPESRPRDLEAEALEALQAEILESEATRGQEMEEEAPSPEAAGEEPAQGSAGTDTSGVEAPQPEED